MRARRGVLALTAGGDLLGRRNVGKVKRTMYCDVDKAYFLVINQFIKYPYTIPIRHTSNIIKYCLNVNVFIG